MPRRRVRSSISANTPSAVSRSRLPVGSSASTQSGAPASARAIATRWRSPPESCDGRCCEPLAEADLAERLGGARARLGGGQAADAQRHRDVVERGELGQQVVELVDEAEMAVAPFALLGRARGSRSRGRRAATLPAVGASRPPSRCSSVLLPEPDAPTMASVSPRRDVEVDALQHVHVDPRRAAALGEALVQAGGDDHVGRSPAAGHRRRRRTSLIAQRLGRLHPARAPARVERGEEGQHAAR